MVVVVVGPVYCVLYSAVVNRVVIVLSVVLFVCIL